MVAKVFFFQTFSGGFGYLDLAPEFQLSPSTSVPTVSAFEVSHQSLLPYLSSSMPPLKNSFKFLVLNSRPFLKT